MEGGGEEKNQLELDERRGGLMEWVYNHESIHREIDGLV